MKKTKPNSATKPTRATAATRARLAKAKHAPPPPASAGPDASTPADRDEVIHLSATKLQASPTNPRKTFDQDGLNELAASIKQHGILQPLLVRPLPEPGGVDHPLVPTHEIVCGERRWRAARLAELDAVPVIIRQLSAEHAVVLQHIENLQRADLSPLEEAEGYKALIDARRFTADTLAESLGKSRSHIFARLRLTRLQPPVREALTAGQLDASKAGLIAQVADPAKQQELLDYALEPHWDDTLPSFRDLKQTLENDYQRDLRQASFDRKRADYVFPLSIGSAKHQTMPKYRPGPCKTCPKRTGNMPHALEGASPDICTDIDCYQGKTAAEIRRRLAEAERQGQTTLDVADYRQRCEEYVELDAKNWADPEGRTWRECLKPSPNVIALAVTQSREGERIIEVYRKDLARAVAEKFEIPTEGTPLGPERAPANDSAAIRAEQARKRARREAIRKVAAEILARLADAGQAAGFWRFIATAALHNLTLDQTGEAALLAQAWRTDAADTRSDVDACHAALDEAATDETRLTMAIQALAAHDFMNYYAAEPGEPLQAAAAYLRFDLEAAITAATQSPQTRKGGETKWPRRNPANPRSRGA